MNNPTSKIETITPAIAKEYLKANAANRPIRSAHVQKLKEEMSAGRWLVTHQGIAFDEFGKLLDGQHRLFAVAMGNTAVKMMVTRGLSIKSAEHELYTMDVIDCGRGRTTGDQLHLMHGQQNANLAAATMSMITMIACGGSGSKFVNRALSVGQAVLILDIYRDPFESLVEFCGKSKVGRVSPVLAALSLGYNIDADVALEFILGVATGENLNSGNPIYALREHLLSKPTGSTREARYKLAEVTANCFYHAIKGENVNTPKPGAMGVEFLMSKQKKQMEAVRAAIGFKRIMKEESTLKAA